MQLQKALEMEHMGALYEDANGAIQSTDTVTSGSAGGVRGTLKIPSGSLRGVFHNHPRRGKRDRCGEEFSQEDKGHARRLGVPSYILTPSGRVRRFDPSTGKTTDVLEELPIDALLKHFGSRFERALLAHSDNTR